MFVTFTIQPVDGDGRNHRVLEVSGILQKAGLKHHVGPRGNVVQGDWEEILAAIRQCHAASAAQHQHVITTIIVDDQAEGSQAFDKAVKTVEQSDQSKSETGSYWAWPSDRDF